MTSITDLTIDDFQHLFIYLNSTDLINLSDTNTYLRNVVKLYLNSKLQRKIVLQCGKSFTYTYCDRIILKNFQIVLKFIRIFGDQFKILFFWIVNSKKCQIANIYLNTYCQNLETLLFRSLELNSNFIFHNNLSIKNLFFEFCNLPLGLCQLIKNFPNLEKLFLYESETSDNQLISFELLYSPVIVSCPIYWENFLIERQKFIGN